MGSWVWAPEVDQVVWSDNSFRLIGFEPGTVTPSPELVLERAHPDDRQGMAAELDRIRGGKITPRFDFRVVLPDGTTRYMRSIMARAPDEPDGYRRLFGTVQDITDQRLAEREVALHVVTSEALSDWPSLEVGANHLLSALGQELESVLATFWVPADDALVARAMREKSEATASIENRSTPKSGPGAVGEAWELGVPISRALATNAKDARSHALAEAGARSVTAFPALNGTEVLAVFEFCSSEAIEPSDRLIRTLVGIGHQIGQFLGGLQLRAPGPGDLPELAALTARECDVLKLISTGAANCEIAQRLAITEDTVKSHIKHILQKLGARNRTEAAHVYLGRPLG